MGGVLLVLLSTFLLEGLRRGAWGKMWAAFLGVLVNAVSAHYALHGLNVCREVSSCSLHQSAVLAFMSNGDLVYRCVAFPSTCLECNRLLFPNCSQLHGSLSRPGDEASLVELKQVTFVVCCSVLP